MLNIITSNRFKDLTSDELNLLIELFANFTSTDEGKLTTMSILILELLLARDYKIHKCGGSAPGVVQSKYDI